MRKIIPLAILLLLSLFGLSTTSAAAATVFVNGESENLSLGVHASILEDAGKNMTVQQVIASVPEQWKKSNDAVINFSFSPSAYWIHLQFEGQEIKPLHMMLEAAMPLHDYFDVYYVKNNNIIKKYLTGDRRPYSTRPVVSRDFVFPLELHKNEKLDVYMRVDTHDGLYDAIPLTLWSEHKYNQASRNEAHIFGYYYGAILAILVYNILLFFSTRDKLFLFYSFYLGTFFIWNLTFRGYSFEYLWPEWSRFNNEILSFSGAMIFISLIIFATKFLNTRVAAPRIHRVLWFLAFILFITLPMSLMNMYAASFQLIIPAGVASLVILIFVALRETLRGSRPARFFLIAWAILILSAIIYYLRVFGVLPSNFVTEEGLNIGSAMEFILLAYALADRINTLTKEKIAAQELANEAQRQMTYKLEDKVRERTEQLEELNKQLQYASITDELTGLYNRRHFNAVIEKEINRCKRDNKVLAFVIMDIDKFKQYNDRYGHLRGDEALIQVSNLIKQTLKRSSDIAFRLGGEEVGIILSADNEDVAYDFIEALRSEIESMAIAHEENDPPVITASFGMVVVTDYSEITPHLLYGQADKALYRAKQEGRNKVVLSGQG